MARTAELTRQRDPRFLLFIGLVVGAMAIGLKSELLTPTRVWALAGGLFVLALAALLLYLRSEREMPSVEHFIPAVLGIVALTGLSFIIPEWWKYLVAAVVFAVAFFLAGYFDYLRLRQHEKPGHMFIQEAVLAVVTVAAYLVILRWDLALLPKLIAIGVVSWLATYRSFRVLGKPMPPVRAFLFATFVAQAVTLLAWAMSIYVLIGEGLFAGMLLLAWYINRGVIRHALEDTLTRRVVFEFGVLALFLAYLFFANFQAPGS